MSKFLKAVISKLVDFAFWSDWYFFLLGIFLSMVFIDLITPINFGNKLFIAPLAAAIQFFGCMFLAYLLNSLLPKDNGDQNDK